MSDSTSQQVALTKRQALKLSVAADADERTVRKLYGGKPVREASASRIVEAAKVLGLPTPPQIVLAT